VILAQLLNVWLKLSRETNVRLEKDSHICMSGESSGAVIFTTIPAAHETGITASWNLSLVIRFYSRIEQSLSLLVRLHSEWTSPNEYARWRPTSTISYQSSLTHPHQSESPEIVISRRTALGDKSNDGLEPYQAGCWLFENFLKFD